MFIFEPCCIKKQLLEVRGKIKDNGITVFEGWGDLSLTELLPALLTRYSETKMMIVAPALPNQAAKIIRTWMKRQWARADGKGKLNVIGELTIVADLSEEASPMASAWLQENPFEGRLRLVNTKQKSTAILLPDLAIMGPVNMQYGERFVAAITTRKVHVPAIWDMYEDLIKATRSAEAPSSSES